MIMFWTHHPRLSYRHTECYRMSFSYSFEHYFCMERFSHRFFMCTQTHACEWMRPHFRHVKSGYILCANYLQKSDVQCLAEWTQSVSVSAAHLCHLALTDSGTQASPGEIQLFSVNYWSKKIRTKCSRDMRHIQYILSITTGFDPTDCLFGIKMTTGKKGPFTVKSVENSVKETLTCTL